jgi:drug/metabolite transporter (DMT)-like permease
MTMEVERVHVEENKSCTNAGLITFTLGLVAGTFSALVCKMAYDTKSVGLDGTEKVFAKPIMMLTLMFAGMSPALLFWYIHQRTLPPEKRDVIPMKTVAVLIVPSLCDLFCTLLLLVAQLYITASLWQMMRGSIIIITALLKRFALGHQLKMHMWLGVSVITLAMILVASTSFVGPSADVTSSKDPRIGILLVLVGCVAQGVQCK